MTAEVEADYACLLQTLGRQEFSPDEHAAIANRLDDDLGLSAIARQLWTRLSLDLVFSSQPGMFMARPPGENISAKAQEHVQWTWRDHHFMLFAAPLEEPGQSMLGLLIADADPVLEVYVQHDPDDRTLLKNCQLYAMKPGVWIDDFLSYYGAFCRLRTVSEAAREKHRPEIEEFWRKAGI